MKLNEMSWPHIKSVAEKSVAILPIAAIEQHGPQLTVSTDSTIVTALAERVESSLREESLLCPTLSFGSSNHHFGFPGTLSIGHETYARVLVDLAASLVESGFRHIVLFERSRRKYSAGKFCAVATFATIRRHDCDQHRIGDVLGIGRRSLCGAGRWKRRASVTPANMKRV